MLTDIVIKNFRCIKGSHVDLLGSNFNVLVGPNGSGKSSFLDALEFVRDCVLGDLQTAIGKRSSDFRDLTFMREGDVIMIVCEFQLVQCAFQKVLYSISICFDNTEGIVVSDEFLVAPELRSGGKTLRSPLKFKDHGIFVGHTKHDNNYEVAYYSEMDIQHRTIIHRSDRRRTALSLVPPDRENYPTANLVRDFIVDGVKYIQLNSRAMKDPCPALSPTSLNLDGSNLAKVIGHFIGKNGGPKSKGRATKPEAFKNWIGHLKFALPGLSDIYHRKRIDDNAEYIVLKYDNGLECPSWLLSDGTLRILALTLLAYLPPKPGIYLVEEPEDGVHPRGLDVVLDSLSSVPGSQVMVTTHSPMVIEYAGKDALLCFDYDKDGTHIRRAEDHPVLKDWDGIPDLGTIYASGILG
ncbi:MAG: AAA family ATPase [Planctomycetes bacterium]|nr:AAA family ATPase [Planctomycetota bacterium]